MFSARRRQARCRWRALHLRRLMGSGRQQMPIDRAYVRSALLLALESWPEFAQDRKRGRSRMAIIANRPLAPATDLTFQAIGE